MSFKGITIKKIDDGKDIKVAVPANARLGTPIWSPDGQRFAISNTTPTAIELYVGIDPERNPS